VFKYSFIGKKWAVDEKDFMPEWLLLARGLIMSFCRVCPYEVWPSSPQQEGVFGE
jgi:hypothetical protein